PARVPQNPRRGRDGPPRSRECLGRQDHCPVSSLSGHIADGGGHMRLLGEPVPHEGARMPSYLSPGVYVEEVQSGSRPIEGVGTAVAAFVGFAEKGPFHTPTLVTNWSQYVQTYGDMVEGTYLAHAVYGYLANGGGNPYGVGGGGPPPSPPRQAGPKARPARGPPPPRPAHDARAPPPAAAGEIAVEVADPDGEGAGEDRFKLLVRQAGKVVETFDVSFKKNTKNYVVTQVRERSKLITVEEAAPANALARPAKQTVTLA